VVHILLIIYLCASGSLNFIKTCYHGCIIMPGGYSDFCSTGSNDFDNCLISYYNEYPGLIQYNLNLTTSITCFSMTIQTSSSTTTMYQSTSESIVENYNVGWFDIDDLSQNCNYLNMNPSQQYFLPYTINADNGYETSIARSMQNINLIQQFQSDINNLINNFGISAFGQQTNNWDLIFVYNYLNLNTLFLNSFWTALSETSLSNEYVECIPNCDSDETFCDTFYINLYRTVPKSISFTSYILQPTIFPGNYLGSEKITSATGSTIEIIMNTPTPPPTSPSLICPIIGIVTKLIPYIGGVISGVLAIVCK